MKAMTKEEQMKTVGGATKHWHWFCNINDFLSSKHEKKEIAYYYAGRHVGRYPDHDGHVTVDACTSSW